MTRLRGVAVLRMTAVSGDGALADAEDDGLLLLERRGDVALGADQGLLADVVGRNQVAVRVRHLEVVAEDAVVAHPQRADPGAAPLLLLEAGDVRARPLPGGEQVVELGVGSGPHRAAVTGV